MNTGSAENSDKDAFLNIEGRTFDIAIIGGGINGTAVADLLSQDGYSVLVVEKKDFGSGATSRSGRVNHCGLRYLDRGEPVWNFIKHPGWLFEQIRRARATMKHRAEMADDYPDHVQATTMILPVRQTDFAAPWMISAAFRLLAAIGPSKPSLDMRRIPQTEWDSTPYIRMMGAKKPLKAVFSFREYQYYWPERLAVDYALAAEDKGAQILNYTSVDDLTKHDGGWRLKLGRNDTDIKALCNAKLVINATGAWADRLLGLTTQTPKQRIAATKGTFVAVKLSEDCKAHSIATFDRRGYPFYCLAALDYHIIGPTEGPNDLDLDRPLPRHEDIVAILENFNSLFPGHHLTESDVSYCWTGIRPMPHRPDVQGKQNLIPEFHDHSNEGMPNLWTLSGGPLMVHRITARTIRDTIRTQLHPETKEVARADANLCRRDSGSHSYEKMKQLEPEAIKRIVLHEHVATLSDLLFRRLGTGWYPGMALNDVHRVAGAMGQALGWSAEQIGAEVEIYKQEIQEFDCPSDSEKS